MLFSKITLSEDWETSMGILSAHKAYAVPQDVYLKEIYGKVGHTNEGPCSPLLVGVPVKPALPSVLDPDAPKPKKSK